jgi:hypothetical protein
MILTCESEEQMAVGHRNIENVARWCERHKQDAYATLFSGLLSDL